MIIPVEIMKRISDSENCELKNGLIALKPHSASSLVNSDTIPSTQGTTATKRPQTSSRVHDRSVEVSTGESVVPADHGQKQQLYQSPSLVQSKSRLRSHSVSDLATVPPSKPDPPLLIKSTV